MSNAFEFTNFAEVKELRETKYGNSLIETVSLALKNKNGSIDEVTKLLQDLLYDLNKQQKDSDEWWEKENARLKAKIAKLKNEIDKLNGEIADDEAEKLHYEKLRDQAQKNLEQYRKQLEADRKSVQSIKKKRAADAQEFKNSQANHTDVINAVEAVIAELSKLIGSVSGKGRPVHVKEIAAEKRDREYAAQQEKESSAEPEESASAQSSSQPEESASEKSSNGGETSFPELFESFLQVTRDEEEANLFVQMATTADQAALQKLIGMLEHLRDSVKKSLNDDKANEDRSRETFEKLQKNLEKDIKKLGSQIKKQEENLKKYLGEIERLRKRIMELKKLRDSKIKQRKETIKERNQKEAQYNADKAERDSERTVINRLTSIVKKRLANMSKYLRSQTGGF